MLDRDEILLGFSIFDHARKLKQTDPALYEQTYGKMEWYCPYIPLQTTSADSTNITFKTRYDMTDQESF